MIKFMKEILDKLLSVILSLLPLSPFADAIDNLSQLPYLGYLNYFCPGGYYPQDRDSLACCYRTLLSVQCVSPLVKLIE